MGASYDGMCVGFKKTDTRYVMDAIGLIIYIYKNTFQKIFDKSKFDICSVVYFNEIPLIYLFMRSQCNFFFL
jgi:hypothetical protein